MYKVDISTPFTTHHTSLSLGIETSALVSFLPLPISNVNGRSFIGYEIRNDFEFYFMLSFLSCIKLFVGLLRGTKVPF
jgi:hypothetical protein